MFRRGWQNTPQYHPVSGTEFMFGLPSGTVMSRFLLCSLVVCSCPCAAPVMRRSRLLWDRGHLCIGSASSVWDSQALSFLAGLIHDPHPTLKESGCLYLVPTAPFISVECLFPPRLEHSQPEQSRRLNLSSFFAIARSSLFLCCCGNNATSHYSGAQSLSGACQLPCPSAHPRFKVTVLFSGPTSQEPKGEQAHFLSYASLLLCYFVTLNRVWAKHRNHVKVRKAPSLRVEEPNEHLPLSIPLCGSSLPAPPAAAPCSAVPVSWNKQKAFDPLYTAHFQEHKHLILSPTFLEWYLLISLDSLTKLPQLALNGQLSTSAPQRALARRRKT